jgi:hypothetical protein
VVAPYPSNAVTHSGWLADGTSQSAVAKPTNGISPPKPRHRAVSEGLAGSVSWPAPNDFVIYQQS